MSKTERLNVYALQTEILAILNRLPLIMHTYKLSSARPIDLIKYRSSLRHTNALSTDTLL